MQQPGFSRGARRPVQSLLLVLLLLGAGLASTFTRGLAATTVSASLHPTQFSVDDTAVLTITVNGSTSADIHLPRIAGITVQGRGRSTRVQFINGSVSSSIAYTYIVQADHPGSYTIPPISISTGATTLTTGAIGFQVTGSGSASPNPGPGNSPATRLGAGDANKIAFLRVTVQKDKSWIGEVIPIRIKAYFRQSIKASLNSLPILKGDGLVMPQLSQKPPQTVETVDGTSYSVLTWNTSISAVKEGRHSLSLELDATLQLPQRRVNPFPGFGGQDPFQSFFQNNFFQGFLGSYRSKNVKMTSRPITIESRPLPTANQPPDFSGAIGQFKLSVKAKPDTVNVGDPITLDMIVSGQGNFDRVETPKFPDDPKWKSYPPSSEFKQEDDPTRGRKKFEQAIIVKDGSVTDIPSVSFSFFDPTAEKYVTLTSGPIPLTVKKTAPAQPAPPQSPPPGSTASAPQVEPGGHGIAGLAPIHLELGRLQTAITPLFARGWFIVMVAFCVILITSVFIWKMRIRHLEKNPYLQSKKHMSELLSRKMVRVKEAASQGDSRQYLAVCRSAIQEVLGSHWHTEPSAITLADLQARLNPSSGLITIFAAAEQGAYASYTLSAEQIREYSDLLYTELSGLQ